MSSLYPENRYDYTYTVGETAEQFVAGLLELEGHKIQIHEVNSNGVDICFESENVGTEVWNWRSPHCYNNRIQSVLENLKPYKYKFLITSHISKEMRAKIENHFEEDPVKVIELGFQILPTKYEKFYTKVKDTYGKKFVSKRTRILCRNILTPLFNTLKKEHNIGYVYSRSSSLLESPSSFSSDLPDRNWNGKTKQLIISSPDQIEETLPSCNVILHSLDLRCSSLESFALYK